MANYDWFDDDRAKRDSIRHGLVSRMRANGYGIIWRQRSPGAGSAWAADHIAHLECLWCGVLVWNDRLHRQFCTGPIVGDTRPEAPHSRACGWEKHDHGSACHSNCPSCAGRP